jgi:hypothetical protein
LLPAFAYVRYFAVESNLHRNDNLQLKAIAVREREGIGVEVWSYMDQRELIPRTAEDKIMFSLRSYGDEKHRAGTA